MAKHQIPKTLGRYKLIREIGRGAMGIVYEGLDPVIGRRVAIKAARRDLLDGEERTDEMMERFIREAHAAGQLNHPGIITVYDADQEKDIAFIAMEYMTGGSLKDRLRDRGRLEAKEAVKIGVAICSALAAAHDLDVVHRDVKPANILMHRDGSIKVADFGIAHVSDSTLTQDGAIVGTPYCMSPEQVMGKKVDGRSDLFSVGVILYEMLTGQRPFVGDAFGAILHKIVNEDPAAPHEMDPEINENLSRVVMKALSKAPEHRYQDGRIMAAALRESLKEEPDPAALGLDETMAMQPRIPQHDVSTVLSMLTPEQRAAVGFEESLQERVAGASSFTPRVSRLVKRGTLLPAIVTTLFLLIVGIMVAVTVIGRQQPTQQREPNAAETAPADRKDTKTQDSKPATEEKSKPSKSKKQRTPRKAETQKTKDSEPEQQEVAKATETPDESPKQPSEAAAPPEKPAEKPTETTPAEQPVQVAKAAPETPPAPSQPEQPKPQQETPPPAPPEQPVKAPPEQAPPAAPPEQAAPPAPPEAPPAPPVSKEKTPEPAAPPPPPPAAPPTPPAATVAQPPASPPPAPEVVPPATVVQPPVPPAASLGPLPMPADDVNALAQLQGGLPPQPTIPSEQAQGLLSVLPSVGKLSVTLWFADTREAWDAALNTKLDKGERYTRCKTTGTVTAVVRDATSPTQPVIDTQVIISASTMLIKTPCPQISVTFQREGYKSVERQYSADCPGDSITDDVVMRSLTLAE